MILELAFVASIAIKPVDGDTFWYGDEKIRLAAIDTPEPTKYGNSECLAERLLGDLASGFTAEILRSERIQIRRVGKGRYKRTLAYVETEQGDLGERLIAAGLAKPYEGRAVDWCH